MVLIVIFILFIYQIWVWGDFSLIYIFFVVVIVLCVLVIWQIWCGNVWVYKIVLISVYIGGIFGVGIFIFWLGWMMNVIFFGGFVVVMLEQVWYVIVVVVVVVGFGYVYMMYVMWFWFVLCRGCEVCLIENV